MRFTGSFRRRLRAAVGVACCYAVALAPIGCVIELDGSSGAPATVFPGNGGGSAEAPSDPNAVVAGLFINSDVADPLVIAGRGPTGEAIFVYGARGSTSGALEQLDAIVVQDRNGATAFLSFENGWPVHLQGFDGGYTHIVYEDPVPPQLSATVEFYNAATNEIARQTIEIDLEQTAAEVAAAVERATGLQLDPPTEADLAAKEVQAAQGAVTVTSPLFTLVLAPFLFVFNLATVIVGQVINAMVDFVEATLRAQLLLAFGPLFLASEILGGGLSNVRSSLLQIEFVDPPARPAISLRL